MNGLQKSSLLLSGGVLAAMAACGSSKVNAPEPLPPGVEATPMYRTFTACDHGNRLYHVTGGHGDAMVAVVPQDLSCKDGAR